MTATLAAELRNANVHMHRVRAEYERTKDDHAQPTDPEERVANGRVRAPLDYCKYDHRMTEANTKVYVDRKGGLHNRCRACMARRSQESRDRKKAQ